MPWAQEAEGRAQIVPSKEPGPEISHEEMLKEESSVLSALSDSLSEEVSVEVVEPL